MSKYKVFTLIFGMIFPFVSQSQTTGNDPDYCSRLMHEALMSRATKTSPDEVQSPAFSVEERHLFILNTASIYRKVATVTYHPDNPSGFYSLQMGAGQLLYTGNSLLTLTRRMNSASTTVPGETVYVKLSAPADHLEGLQQSLKMQQSVVGDEVQVMPISGEALDAETLNLLFTYPVKEIKETNVPAVAAGERTGWVQATLDFVVGIGHGVKHIHLTLMARSSEVLANLVDTMRGIFVHQSATDTRSITEIVSAARVKVKRDHGHVADVDYLVRAEMGHSFMVALAHPNGDCG